MNSEIVIIGAKDRELERLLAAINLRTRLSCRRGAGDARARRGAPARRRRRRRARRPGPAAGRGGPQAPAPDARRCCSSPRRSSPRRCSRRCAPASTSASPSRCRRPSSRPRSTRLLAHKQPPSRPGRCSPSSAPRAASARPPSRSTSRPRWSRAPASRTLLIDLHLAHGDAAVFLGVEPRFSVVDALENIHRFDEAFFKGLVVQTPARPAPAGLVRPAAGPDQQRAARAQPARVRGRPLSATSCSTCRGPTPPPSTRSTRRRGSSSSPTRSWRRCATPAASRRRCASATATTASR